MKQTKVDITSDWKDIKNIEDKIIASYKIINSFTVKVHHFSEHGELWCATIPGILDHEYLGIIELEEAKKEVLKRFKNILEKTLDLFNDKNINKNMKRTKWKK